MTDDGALTTDFENPQAIELRGYEVAKQEGKRWVQVLSYRPNQYGWKQAVRDVKGLCEEHPEVTYRIRPIVSLEPTPVLDKLLTAPKEE